MHLIVVGSHKGLAVEFDNVKWGERQRGALGGIGQCRLHIATAGTATLAGHIELGSNDGALDTFLAHKGCEDIETLQFACTLLTLGVKHNCCPIAVEDALQMSVNLAGYAELLAADACLYLGTLYKHELACYILLIVNRLLAHILCYFHCSHSASYFAGISFSSRLVRRGNTGDAAVSLKYYSARLKRVFTVNNCFEMIADGDFGFNEDLVPAFDEGGPYACAETIGVRLPETVPFTPGDGDELAVMCGSECRGTVASLADGLYRLKVYAHTTDEPLTLAYYSAAQGKVYRTTQPLTLKAARGTTLYLR